jgi:hypothetical protein
VRDRLRAPSAVGTVGYGRASPFDCAAYPWWRGDGTTPGLEVDGAIAYDAFGRSKADEERGRRLPGFGPMASTSAASTRPARAAARDPGPAALRSATAARP